MTKPATIRQADIARAVKAAISAGMTELRIVLSASDDEIQSITGHTTKAMVRKYAGPVRQIAQAKRAARKLERNVDGT